MSDHQDKTEAAGGLSAVDRSVGRCADCGGPIGQDNGPSDGWQLEDGRTVCHACCSADFKRICDVAIELHRTMRVVH